MIINVASDGGLSAAVKSANDGDVIQLASGVYNIDIRNASFANGLTITSAPGANVVVSNLFAYYDTGLTFRGLELVQNDTTSQFHVVNSSNITLDHLYVHGSLDGDATNDGSGLLIRSSTNVTVANSEFQQLYTGLSHLEDNGLVIRGDYFHEMSMDAVRGGGSSNVVIDQNVFTNFQREGTVHPDAIQFWTTNETTSAQNITITNNAMFTGAGTQFQGVFMRDEVGTLPYIHVNISNNVILGTSYHGISVLHGSDVNVTHNVVVNGMSDPNTAWIDLTGVDSGTLANNVATSYVSQSDATVHSNDQTVAAYTDGGYSWLNDWLFRNAGLPSLPSAASQLVDPASYTTVAGTASPETLAATSGGGQFIVGGDGADTLTGDYGQNILAGGAGNDLYLLGYSNNVVLENPGGGVDTVRTGADVYTLPENVENLQFYGTGGSIGNGNELGNNIRGNGHSNSLFGYAGNDYIYGGDGSDTLDGGDGSDTLDSGGGNDKLFGDAGNDSLMAGAGNDKLWGGDGDDTLVAGSGYETVNGGAGADKFVITSSDPQYFDRIEDFNPSESDKIYLRRIDADVNTIGSQHFHFIGTAAFSHVAGELRYEVNTTNSVWVYGDVNGDGVADVKLMVVGVGSLTSGNFIF